VQEYPSGDAAAALLHAQRDLEQGPAGLPVEDPGESDPRRSPQTPWRPWTAPLALIMGLVLATIGGLIVDLPALALGVKLTASSTPPGLAIADTFVQDVGFVLAAVYCAHIGSRAVRGWQLGLRRPGVGWVSAAGLVLLLLALFVVVSVVWSQVFNPERETLLNQLGSNEGTALLVLSAALTCVVAPICEEVLFRGYIFTALRNWRGTLPGAILTGLIFGGVHAGSAPVLDLAPLAALGFGLCLLYRATGSLYPGIFAHALNNCIAFSSLENWGWQLPVLTAAALLAIASLIAALNRLGLSGSGTLWAGSDS
jgi:hypothetical protein